MRSRFNEDSCRHNQRSSGNVAELFALDGGSYI